MNPALRDGIRVGLGIGACALNMIDGADEDIGRQHIFTVPQSHRKGRLSQNYLF